ncbi:MAG: TetR/AcrR family transcriptional regulator [Labilithrix sp.]|nr:TetR/AcrR family transcriptional regulator [Labilithrix sp.]
MSVRKTARRGASPKALRAADRTTDPVPARAGRGDGKRTRRSPEEARTLILEAAGRLFETHLPDAVGLKDVAREAGVSHALVTHYFGTYAALVEATLERRFHQLRDELVPIVMTLITDDADAKAMLAAHRRAIAKAAADPATLRLVIWALLSGRVAADDFFPHRMQGLKLLADSLEARSPAPREDLEFLLIASFALTTTWTFGRRAFAGALGRKSTRELEEAFDRRIDAMLEAFLRSAERRGR